MSDTAWLTIALAAVGAGIGGYVASLRVRRRRLEARHAELAGARTDDDLAPTQ